MNRRAFLKLCAFSALTYGSTWAQSGTSTLLVKKKTFSLESVFFPNANRSIPVKVGYETYGRLNAAKDNAILICHYFAGTGHAAGKYRESDPAPGWWDSLIGPGKAINTEKYFVISSDILCNLNAFNPDVVTTGPASLNPESGKEYALDFPLFTLREIVSVQRELVRSLGIEKLRMVAGPSLGGLQSFAWARYFPDMVEKILPVISLPVISPLTVMDPGQLAIDAIRLDPHWNHGNYYHQARPDDGLMLAFKILFSTIMSDSSMQERFGRKIVDPQQSPYKSLEGRFLVEKGLEDFVAGRLHTFDANSYIYLSKAVALYDLAEPGQSTEEALAAITTPTLMVNDESDLLFGPEPARRAASMLGNCELHLYNSGNGHLSGVFETGYFASEVTEFLES